MHEIFYPNSIAVIGVSPRPAYLGRNIVANLNTFGFQGIVYPVGRSGGVIATRRIYHTVTEIPDKVDLAVILTPAPTIPSILDECGQKGVRWAVIETAGFREYGEQGKHIETQMMQVADRYGIRFVGPNGIGVINMENGLSLPFLPLGQFLKRGDISIITQSGGVGLSVLNQMANEGLGLNKLISAGNMLSIGAEELLQYLIEDPGTRVIFLYLEGIMDGRRLMEVAGRSPKPILVLKGNVGRLGKRIAASHTASLASDDEVVDAAFRQCGMIRVQDSTSLIHNLKILQLPAMAGRNLAIISRSGGHAVIAADACEMCGFELAEFPPEFLAEIEQHFRASVIKLSNPLDLGDLLDLDVYLQIVERTLAQSWVDGVFFLYMTSPEMERDQTRVLVRRLDAIAHQHSKPLVLYITTGADELAYLKKTVDLPIFSQIVETIRALQLSHTAYRASQELKLEDVVPVSDVDREAASALIGGARSAGRDLLLHEAIAVLGHYGFPVIPYQLARTVEEAQAAAARLGYPVVLKVVSADISHKSDVGGVRLGLRDSTEVAAAFQEMVVQLGHDIPGTLFSGVLVQPMSLAGQELILGGRQDHQFGPVVLVGVGGVLVEVLNQTALRVAPIGRHQAMAMVEELSVAQILKGVRGDRGYDLNAICDALQRLSKLLDDFPEIKELDINPLRVFQGSNGCQALDARIILR